jgi:hypothetical protein
MRRRARRRAAPSVFDSSPHHRSRSSARRSTASRRASTQGLLAARGKGCAGVGRRIATASPRRVAGIRDVAPAANGHRTCFRCATFRDLARPSGRFTRRPSCNAMPHTMNDATRRTQRRHGCESASPPRAGALRS